jgi:glutamine synthetase
MAPSFQAFLDARPALRFIDLLLPDLNAVDRGKRIDRASAAAVFERGLLLPGSMFALDVPGGTIQATGLGFDEGDADRACLPLAGTLFDVPWLGPQFAQAQLCMRDHGAPFFGDPRARLTTVLERFDALSLRPVVALEYEFYLIDGERDARGGPQPPRGPLTGRREHRTQINSMTDLDEYSTLLADIDAACRVQQVPTTSALAEYGPGQFEINFAHGEDVAGACDAALRFRRIVRSIARRHGIDASFMAKPYADMAGSGLHLHVSVLDAQGRNLFAGESGGNSALRSAIAGAVATLADGMAVFAPNANSWRRFQAEAYVPLTADWSVNNRGTAVRIPVSDAANRRLEHRVAGADANPYLVTAWVLAGVLHGLTQRLEAAAPLEGNAYHRGESPQAPPAGEALPLHWVTAIDRFRASAFARATFGDAFTNLFATVKAGELADFSRHITPLEYQWYLHAI